MGFLFVWKVMEPRDNKEMQKKCMWRISIFARELLEVCKLQIVTSSQCSFKVGES